MERTSDACAECSPRRICWCSETGQENTRTHPNRPVVALYERADHPGRFPANPVFHRALADPTLHKTLVMVGEEVGYGLV